MRLPPDPCEYCDADPGLYVLYAWKGDTWCEPCMLEYGASARSIRAASPGRPPSPAYDEPFIWSTPDGRVTDGLLT